MVDRQKVEAVLTRRFPGAGHRQISAAANAIVGLDDEWEEVVDRKLGYYDGSDCRDVCYLAREFDRGAELRVFRRRDWMARG